MATEADTTVAIDPLFDSHKLNDEGVMAIGHIRASFTGLLRNIEATVGTEKESARALAICRTELERACLMAVKATAQNPKYQQASLPSQGG